jgi:hypothetical protein
MVRGGALEGVLEVGAGEKVSGEGGAEDGLRLGNKRYAVTSGVLVERLYSDNRRCVRLADCGRAVVRDSRGRNKRAKGAWVVEAETDWA